MATLNGIPHVDATKAGLHGNYSRSSAEVQQRALAYAYDIILSWPEPEKQQRRAGETTKLAVKEQRE